jgi:hypothetical protein
MDIKNSCDVEEDDWENAIIPDLISERERKLIEERKKVEEADGILVEALFSDSQKIEYNVDNKQIILNKKEKPKGLENRREQLIKNQKEKSELIKKMKLEKKRMLEIYGAAELDEYDEVYGYIQDKY